MGGDPGRLLTWDKKCAKRRVRISEGGLPQAGKEIFRLRIGGL